jgi:hypothetical protein
MRDLAKPFRRLFARCFREAALRKPGRANRARPRLEALEDRLVPAVAHTASLTLQGTGGTVTLSSSGLLQFQPTALGPAVALESICSAFNVDGNNNLFELNSRGRLWELPGGANPAVSGPGGWVSLDSNVGAISVAGGVLEELKMNGNLWRFANGAFSAGPLASGVTRADVDAAGDIVYLKDGTLYRVLPTATTFTPGSPGVLDLNTAAGASDGSVVSFSLGNTTLAFQVGNGAPGPIQGEVLATYDTTAAAPVWGNLFNDATGPGPDLLITEYGVAADGVIFNRTSDPGADPNAQNRAVRIGFGSFDDDLPPSAPFGTVLTVNGGQAPSNGSSFQISPDGTTIAVLSTGGGGNNGDLSVYTEGLVGGVPTLSAETPLDTVGQGTNFGMALDQKVYELTAGPTLQFYDPFASTPVLTPTVVSDKVSQWQLGPAGQLAFLTTDGTFHVGGQSVLGVVQFSFAANGELYYLTGGGDLFQGTGNPAVPGGYNFSRIDVGTSAFAVGTNSALLDVKSNGSVWRLGGDPSAVFSNMPASPATVFNGWVKLFVNADVGAILGAKQAVGPGGTPLFVLPDGDFFLVVANQFTRLTGDKATDLANNQTDIVWEGKGRTAAGITPILPAFNPVLGGGMFFSILSSSGPTSTTPLSLF